MSDAEDLAERHRVAVHAAEVLAAAHQAFIDIGKVLQLAAMELADSMDGGIMSVAADLSELGAVCSSLRDTTAATALALRLTNGEGIADSGAPT